MNTLLFGYFPYVALALFFIISWLRYEHLPYGWRAGSSSFHSKKDMYLASNLFHVGIIIILLGHFFGLLAPHAIYSIFVTAESKQATAMNVGGLAGVMTFVGLVMLIRRRMNNPMLKMATSKSDYVVLGLLAVQALLGLLTIFHTSEAVAEHDTTVMLALCDWAQAIVTLNGADAAEYIKNVPAIYKLHVFFGLVLIAAVPFTRLVHVWSAPIAYLVRVGYQIPI